jgi:peptidyl-prolyl cis-trans isomerase D
MSVIQTIRNKYGKIAGAVIAIALVGFIISDARNGTFGSFFGGHDSDVMKVDGVKIEPREYQERIKEYETLYTMFNKGRPIDDDTRSKMNEQVVQMIVYETVVEKQCAKLGIQTTEEEKKELIYGANADPIIRQFSFQGQQIFINKQGQFDPGYVKGFEKEINEEPQKYDPTGKLSEQWEIVKAYVVRMNNINKFNTMVGAAAYVPVYMAKRLAVDETSMAAIKYVKVPYTTIPDADVKITDDAIKDYMQKHAGLYETTQPTRSIEYVSFDINPSSADTARSLEGLAEIRNDFASAKEKDMKAFVNNKSDDQNSYSGAYVNKNTYKARFADTIMSLPVDAIYGPYYDNGSYKLTKVVDRKTLPDSVKVRHILVMTKQQGRDRLSDTAAKARLDSAIAMLKIGASFDSVVQVYTDDEGSKGNKGEYNFDLQQRAGLAKEFGDFAFEGKTGETKTVKVSNDNYSGYHYIEILEQKDVEPSVLLATVSKSLTPSDSTVMAIYGKANEFAGKNPTAPEFDAAIKKQNINERIGDNISVSNFAITGLGPGREVVKWMFADDRKLGEISPVFQLGDQRYIVAKLSNIQNKGLVELNANTRPVIEQRLRNQMKAEMIAKKYAAGGSLDAIASATGGQVQEADSVTLGNASLPGAGAEPRVVGYAFDNAFQLNTLSPGIPGQGGVYFISVLRRDEKPFDQSMMQIAGQERQRLDYQVRSSLGQGLQQGIIRTADVKYNVSNF